MLGRYPVAACTVTPAAAATTVAAAAIAAILGWGEWVNWRASRRLLGDLPPVVGGSEAVVVLGFRNRGRRANYINRYRVRAALRSLDPAARESVVVFCGGGVASTEPEAELMSRYARRALGYRGPQRLDRASRSTWQNIENAASLIEAFDVVKIVSNPVHAEKARGYLWRQRPDLAARLVRARDYRFGELVLVKPIAAAIGLWRLRGLGNRADD